MRAALVVIAAVALSSWACGAPGPTEPTEPAGPAPDARGEGATAAAAPRPAPTEPTPPSAPDPMDVTPRWAAFARVPRLPSRVARDAYAYFRFINPQFSSVVCADLADFSVGTPVVPLHGDAHLEQYALTDIGRGLTDFDDMATGPAVIDLARMTTSLVLIARLRGFSADAAIDAFLGGYREGLGGKSAPRPSVVAELARRMKHDPGAFLERADKLMLPLDEDPTLSEGEMRVTLGQLEKVMRARDPKLPSWYFTVKKMGPFHAGLGSALDRKFLARLEGVTRKSDDDRVVEVKYVGDRQLAPCVKRRLEHEPTDLREDMDPAALDRFIEPIFVGPSEAWVQEWYPNFYEVESETVTEPQLAEVARDAGSLLAREHVRSASPRNLDIDPPKRARLLASSKALAARVETAWKKFRDGLPREKEARP